MAGRRQALRSTLAHRQRLLLGIGLVLLLFAAAGLGVALGHDPDAPPLAAPASPIFPEVSEPPPVPVLPAPTSASAVPPSSSPSKRSPTTAPRRTLSAPPPARRSAPPSAGAFTARYVVANSRSDTFQAGVFLTNNGKTARSWQVRVTHNPRDGVRVQDAFGAQMSTDGDTTVFSGGPLAAGDSVTFGFRASKSARGVVRPTGCRIDGKNCVVSVR
jgi:hypothetical protein